MAEIKLFALLQLVIGFLGHLFLLYQYEGYNSFYFFVGNLLSALNIAALVIVLKRILSKKSVALPLGVIVSKYAVLGILLNYVTKLEKNIILSFVFGFSMLIPVILLFSLIYFNKIKAIEN